ncbi:MAG: hypothetical protein GY774_17420 [Planctomycetes bacterium]|nr:hypothetical protein [Planctomycetota bacterium]
MNDFYLTLPSNASLLNTTANFSVHLPQKLNLQGRWEVALVEIQYPFSWNNIGGSGDYDKGNWIDVTFQNETTATILIPPGYYSNIHELLVGIEYGKEQAGENVQKSLETTDFNAEESNLLRSHIEDIGSGFYFSFDQIIKRVSCKCRPGKVKKIVMSSKLRYMLGFEKMEIDGDKRNVGQYIPDIRVGFYSLYVYCSLVEPQIVGNVTAPLLEAFTSMDNMVILLKKCTSRRTTFLLSRKKWIA